MRLTRIAFNGYRRLVDTGCNVDSKLVAFLGPNEAGKSSILHALEWWSSGGKLKARDLARSQVIGDSDPVVTLTFILDDADVAEIRKRYILVAPNTQYRVHRASSGKRLHGFSPTLERDWTGLRDLAVSIAGEVDKLTARGTSDAEQNLRSKVATLLSQVMKRKELGSRGISSVGLDADEHAAIAAQSPSLVLQLTELLNLLGKTPFTLAREALIPRLPKIVLYEGGNRSLETRYDLNDLVPPSQAPEPIVNLLAVAEVDVDTLVGQLRRTTRHGLQPSVRARIGAFAASCSQHGSRSSLASDWSRRGARC